jgi:hypothetical protein
VTGAKPPSYAPASAEAPHATPRTAIDAASAIANGANGSGRIDGNETAPANGSTVNGAVNAGVNGAVNGQAPVPEPSPQRVVAPGLAPESAIDPAVGTTVIAATAPATAPATEAGVEDRVTLLCAEFDADTGASEVRLARADAVGIGRASVGALAGGAQATLAALADLGLEVPYYLVSAERAHTVPGEPVVVVLAPVRSAASRAAGSLPPLAERIGVATGDAESAAASRATLNALNRFLSAVGAGANG